MGKKTYIKFAGGDSMFRRRRPLLWVNKSRFTGAPILIFIVFVVAVFWFLAFAERNLGPTIISIAETRAKQMAVEIIHKAVKEEIAENVEYQDLMITHKDKQGHLVMVQPNIVMIDRLQAETALAVNEHFKKLIDEDIGIPLGQILGSKLLASLGPRINIGIMPVGSVDVRMVNGFEEAGINQTRHTIALRVQGDMKIVVPLVSSQTKIVTDILIADNVFFGPVPNIYLNADSGRKS